MATMCKCGNELEETPVSYRVTLWPCSCKKPAGPGKNLEMGIPEWCFKDQYNERKRLGLPLMTDMEKGIRTRWT